MKTFAKIQEDKKEIKKIHRQRILGKRQRVIQEFAPKRVVSSRYTPHQSNKEMNRRKDTL